MPKDGRYFLVKLPMREALEEVASGVFEYAGLNDEHTGDICFDYLHNQFVVLPKGQGTGP